MRAIRVKTGEALMWEEVTDPSPGPGEILIRVQATAVNRGDLLQRRGLYPPPPGAPEWMGLEAAGIVDAVGPPRPGPQGDGSADSPPAEPDWIRPGLPVCCLLAGGGYAERVVVDARQALPIPEGLSFEEAAAIPEAFTTAYLNLFLEAGLKPGETVLIHAGASGVGTAAIQMARDRGARVITTVGTPEKAARVRSLGAAIVILHRSEDVTARLRDLSAPGPVDPDRDRVPGIGESPHGIDVVLDCLGGADLAAQIPLLNPYGRWVLIGLMQGREAGLDLRPLMSRRLRLIGSVLRPRSPAEKGRILGKMRQEIWPRIESGAIRPVVHAVFPIEDAEAAHAMVERNENIGKVVLRISG